MAADATGTAHKGRCPITAIAVAKDLTWDPYVRGPVILIQEWCRLAPEVHLPALTRAWTQMESQLTNATHPWQCVTGPISAGNMHFQEMGWKVDIRGEEDKILYTDKRDDTFEVMDGVSWREFRESLEQDRIADLWPILCKHRAGHGLAQGADYIVV